MFAFAISLRATAIKFDRAELLHDLEILAADDMHGRKTETPGNAKARDYILQRFQQLRLTPSGSSFEHPFTFVHPKDETKTKRHGINLVGRIPGTQSDRTIVVTAHYDHLGIKDGVIYNGADDNASGVAALIAVASYFLEQKPQNTLILAALDAEEQGGQGSKALVETLDRAQIVMNVNLDMLARDSKNILYASGTYHYPCLKPTIEKVAASAPIQLLQGHDRPDRKDVEDWTKESDHYSFHEKGIPFIYFGVEDYEHHHKPTDDFHNITHNFFVNAVFTIIHAIHELDWALPVIEEAIATGMCTSQ